MNVLPYLYTSTLADLMRPRRLLVWIVVALALFGVGVSLRQVNPDGTPRESYLLLTNLVVYRLEALAAAIFALQVIGAEVEGKTIVYLLTRPVPRWVLITGRTLAAGTAVLIATTLALLGVAASVGEEAWRRFPADFSALAIGAFAYTALFVLLSLLVHRAMIWCLLFAFGWETAVPNLQGNAFRLSLNAYLTGISRPSLNVDETAGRLRAFASANRGLEIPAPVAWATLIGFTAVCLVLASLWFSRNEYIAREDAE